MDEDEDYSECLITIDGTNVKFEFYAIQFMLHDEDEPSWGGWGDDGEGQGLIEMELHYN